MRRIGFMLWLLGLVLCAPAAWSQSGKVLKVLPEYVDLKGRTSLSPSLYDRDAYQARRRRDPSQQSGLKFFVNWKAKKAKDSHLKLRLELRGVVGDSIQRRTLEADVDKTSWFSKWTTLDLSGKDYKAFGNLVAWRATLLDGDKKLSEKSSFLW